MITEQPLGEISKVVRGLEKMEVWALEAYGCSNTYKNYLLLSQMISMEEMICMKLSWFEKKSKTNSLYS
jgi:DNA-directed RNA polymerase beta subunit